MFRYQDLLKEVELFEKHGVETGSIGDSTLGQATPYIFVGNKGGRCIIVQGGIHAREHITSLLVVCQAKHLLKHPELLLDGGIYFIPMTNPDGVRLAQEGAGFIRNKELKKNLLQINGGPDFSLWKANINGVDLNTNFDARWGQGKRNVFFRAGANYVGKTPNSEKETKNLIRFTKAVKPLATISYHCKGEIIYWRFFQKDKDTIWRHYRLARSISEQTGYALVSNDGASTGGYKDWCIEHFNIPSFTIEVGSDKFSHPFPYSEFEKILYQNDDIPRRLLNTVAREDRIQKRRVLPDEDVREGRESER